MKEGYLQTKISEQKEQIDLLTERVDLLVRHVKDRTVSNKQLEDFFESNKKNNEKIYSDYETIIKPTFNKLYKEYFINDMRELKGFWNNKIKELINSNKKVTNQFCDEVILQRKDLGIILSLLINKNITTQKEMNFLDKEIRSNMNKVNVRKHIFDMFFPTINKKVRE